MIRVLNFWDVVYEHIGVLCFAPSPRTHRGVGLWSSTRCPELTWASYQIRKIAGRACAGNAGKVFPRRRFQRKPLVSDPGMHHGTCVTHVPWCMSGSLTCGDGENVPGIPRACAPRTLRIWQEAHWQGCCHKLILAPNAAKILSGATELERTTEKHAQYYNCMKILIKTQHQFHSGQQIANKQVHQILYHT